MLSGEELELIEGLSRLCVLRTEDYQLLKSIRKTQETKPDKEYFSYLLAEFRRREQWRSDREVDLLSQLGGWEYNFYTEKRFEEAKKWKSLGPFRLVMLHCIKAVYRLEPSDIQDSPFVTQKWSRFLYHCDSRSPLFEVGYGEVLRLFNEMNLEEKNMVSPGMLLNTLYPLQRDLKSGLKGAIESWREITAVRGELLGKNVNPSPDLMEAGFEALKDDIINVGVKPATRAVLRVSRKVWLVLFLLWKQLLVCCDVDRMRRIDLSRTLSTTAGNFLNTQRCRFVSFLESTNAMCEKTSYLREK